MNIDVLSRVITDVNILSKRYTSYDGFVFTSIRLPGNIYDAILIRNPSTARRFGDADGFSEHSLEDHISFINLHQLASACIIADDISFLAQCPTLEHLTIIPALTAGDSFDYSPLYKLQNLKSLSCATHYGTLHRNTTTIDYSKIKGLEYIRVSSNGDLNYDVVLSLKTLEIRDSQFDDLNWLPCNSRLDSMEITTGKIRCLDGIEHASEMQCLQLCYNRSLQNINALQSVAPTLRALHIENCPKITDFSVLEKLKNLEYLVIKGSNQIPDLSFLSGMSRLQTFIFDVNIADGDLSPCLNLAYARCLKSRKHYKLKDNQLPKGVCNRGNENIPYWRRIV